MDDLVQRLRDEAERLSGRSLSRGCAESGVASNLADAAADRIENLSAIIKNVCFALGHKDHALDL